MTSKPNLSLVRRQAATTSGSQAESLVRHWDPEYQLVGALLHLPRDRVAPILDLVPGSAIWQPDNRWAIDIIRDVVARGADPDPVLVLHTARRRPPDDAARPGESVSAARHHRFAIHLADLYTQAVTPAAARQYARDVLEDAYRRAVDAHATRAAELAQNGASRSELSHHLAGMRATLAELWRRAEAAAR